MKRKNAGVTTIVVVCVMAIIMALSLSLFLTASVLMKTAARTTAVEQCRILAVTLSERIEEQLTDSSRNYGSLLQENAARAEDIHNNSLWHYIKREITDGSWPYYAENGKLLNSEENAVRTFQMEPVEIAGEIAVSEISLYWTPGEENELVPEQLIVKTRVTVKEQSCTITDSYRLNVANKGGYEGWVWEHEDKK